MPAAHAARYTRIKDAISRHIASPDQMAYLGYALLHGSCVIVGGPEAVRRPVADAVRELAGNNGRVFKVSTVGTLRGILLDETPFERTDYVWGTLDSRDTDYLKEFFGLSDTHRVGCVGEASETRLADFVHRLENLDVDRYYLKNDVKICCSVAYAGWEKPCLKHVTEVVGLDSETNELITNTVYTVEKADGESAYSGHSFLFEKIAERRGIPVKEVARRVAESSVYFRKLALKKKN